MTYFLLIKYISKTLIFRLKKKKKKKKKIKKLFFLNKIFIYLLCGNKQNFPGKFREDPQKKRPDSEFRAQVGTLGCRTTGSTPQS